jgi:phosphatidylglycerophosphate synthase
MSLPDDSRAFTDQLLAELRAGRWRAAAWWNLLSGSARRSWLQARARPRAVVELVVVHAAFQVFDRRGKRPVWTVVSLLLAGTHLGMLGARRSLGLADVLTLVRANLPVLAPDSARAVGALALVTDLADGRVARARHATSRFGQYADTFADATFWTWFALRHEPSAALRAAALAAWVAPVVAITTGSVARGRMIDSPRPELLRPAVALQALLAVRALINGRAARPRLARRGRSPRRPAPSGRRPRRPNADPAPTGRCPAHPRTPIGSRTAAR